MTTPTQPVTVTLAGQDGAPYVGVTVRAKLDRNEVYQGIVVAGEDSAVTNSAGVAILNLFPNAPSPTGLGTRGSVYRFRAAIPGGKSLDVTAQVPNSPCTLEAIVITDEPVPPLDAAQTAVLQAQAYAGAAGANAAQTAADRVATGADRVQTGVDRVATAGDRVQTGLDRSTATQKAAEARASADLAASLAPFILDGGTPSTNYGALPAFDGGTP